MIEGLIASTVTRIADLGAKQQRIRMQTETAGSLSDSLDVSISALIDTNLEQESARLKALQVQQRLAIQSLSIANRAPNSVLTLFT